MPSVTVTSPFAPIAGYPRIITLSPEAAVVRQTESSVEIACSMTLEGLLICKTATSETPCQLEISAPFTVTASPPGNFTEQESALTGGPIKTSSYITTCPLVITVLLEESHNPDPLLVSSPSSPSQRHSTDATLGRHSLTTVANRLSDWLTKTPSDFLASTWPPFRASISCFAFSNSCC